MPAKDKLEACILCYPDECECKKPKAKVAKFEVKKTFAPTKIITVNLPALSEDEQVLKDAIVALAPILHPDERKKWAGILTDTTQRAADWRAKNRSGEPRDSQPTSDRADQ